MTAKLDLSQFEGPAGTMVAQESVDLLLALAREQQEQIRALRDALITIEGHVNALASRMISGGDFVKTGTCLLKDVCGPALAALKATEVK